MWMTPGRPAYDGPAQVAMTEAAAALVKAFPGLPENYERNSESSPLTESLIVLLLHYEFEYLAAL
jgi:hypothetical protein